MWQNVGVMSPMGNPWSASEVCQVPCLTRFLCNNGPNWQVIVDVKVIFQWKWFPHTVRTFLIGDLIKIVHKILVRQALQIQGVPQCARPLMPKFPQFHDLFWKIWQNSMLAPLQPSGWSAPPSCQDSWIRSCLDPTWDKTKDAKYPIKQNWANCSI